MEEKKGERKEESERDMESEQMRQIYRHEHKIFEKRKLLPVFLVAMGTVRRGDCPWSFTVSITFPISNLFKYLCSHEKQ